MASTEAATDRVPRRKLDSRVRNYRDSLLVAGPQQAFKLSDTAAFVWRSLDGERTVADVARLVAAEYDVDYATALSDVDELLETLTTAGIVAFRDDG